LLRYRRQKHWAKEIGIEWMDGMPLTARQIHTFCPEYRIQKLTLLLDNLVDKTYLSFEHPKQKVENERIKDKSLPKGYNLITGKLSFELNIIMDPEGIAPTIVATEGDKYGVIDEKKLRRLSSRECLRLFGFPDSYVSNISIKELYDLIGNTVPINVVNFVTDRLLSQT
jgi:DNA (cytosine-5)-methyltransferase 1